MGHPFGQTIDPTAVAGKDTQQDFVSALKGATIGSNGQFQGVPAYGGQLTPELSSTLLGQLGGQTSYNPFASLGGAANAPGPNATGFGGFNANNANMNAPWLTNGANQYSPNGYNMLNGQGAGSLLASTAMGYGPGASVDTIPAWQAMVGAQKQNIQTGADQLAEQFNNGGGLFSSAYGNAAGQYQSNARAQQNAQLSQAQLQAMLGAQGIQANAAGQLGNYQLNLAQQQYGALQNADTAAYQNWYASQPYNNPLLSMMYSQANSYAPPPTQTQGWLPGMLAGAGQAMSGVGAIMAA